MPYEDSEAARRHRREQAALARERELDEHDASVRRGTAITQRAETVALRLAQGTASLEEVQAMLTEDYSHEPYADLSTLQTQCALMGLDPNTGQPI